MSKLILPDAPADLSGPVKAWRQPVSIDTYLPMPADKNPMFLEKRVYQGSSGKVYPLPFTDRISETKSPRLWDAVHIENEYMRLMVLPQIGGRIHIGLDKTNGYDFFYRQNVIKPALVGLAGPWISGGVEFNWPQHHRPSTFMPVNVAIENHADGSVTIWCSEHEPMNRMKGMHGVCLHPGKSLVELKVRLHNRTELGQTFLWWANVAARVHEKYQSFFPPDVSYVADHAKRATSRFPHCAGKYYGVDYAARAREGVPKSELPRQFVPPVGEYSPDDLSWYANIPVPTSYMAMGSSEDFFGGYDHAAEAGLIHFADHHISPGKKQWTWGNHEFGYAWDRNLTDDDGPYIELMAGVFTDNQPDFSFLHPEETRTFSQFWYPIRKIGPAQKANLDVAVSLVVKEGKARAGVALPTARRVEVSLRAEEKVIERRVLDISPANPLIFETAATEKLKLTVADEQGRILIEYSPAPPSEKPVPPPATEPAEPEKITSNNELYLTGVHLDQYRHATRQPDAYWRQALRRDPSDSRCNTAMGVWHLRRGEFFSAVECLTKAVESLTRRNPNPNDGEALYHLGIARRYLGDDQAAYEALSKAAWNFAWQSPAFFALAEIDCRRQDWPAALEHLNQSLRVNAENSRAGNLKAMVLMKLARAEEALELLKQIHASDPLDVWNLDLLGKKIESDSSMRLDLAMDFARSGFVQEAIDILPINSGPIVEYLRANLLEKMGMKDPAAAARKAAQDIAPDYCFPSRLEEIVILQSAIEADPSDARAPYYLGNLFYDRRRHEEAIALWEKSARLDPAFSIVWRNLGIAYFNIRSDANLARDAYDRAFAANPRDARLLYERDQLWKRTGELPARRLSELQSHIDLANQRDDLTVELCALLNQTGRHEAALNILQARKFQPWEGGEGLALGQHVRIHLALGRGALRKSDAKTARQFFETALTCPENLGEARHLLANCSDIHYWIGEACKAAGDVESARRHWSIAADARGDFQEMSVRTFSEMTYFSAMSMRRLGRDAQADRLLRDLVEYARKLENSPAKVDYFATSLPAMLLFDDDLQKRQMIHARLLAAQARLGLAENETAKKLLQQVLQDDPNHPLAADLLQNFLAEEQHAVR